MSEILYLQSRRAVRMRKVQVLQHALAAVVLFTSGYHHLHDNAVLAGFEIAAAALLILAVIRERVKHDHENRRVAWVELAGAIMMYVEAIEKTRQPHHLSFLILSFVQPVVLLLFALFDAQIAARRYVKVDDAGLEIRIQPFFFPKRIPWSGIETYRLRGFKIELGTRSISLRDVVDRDRVMLWIVDALRRRDVAESAAE